MIIQRCQKDSAWRTVATDLRVFTNDYSNDKGPGVVRWEEKWEKGRGK